MTKRIVHVVGAVIESDMGEILCALRGPSMEHAFMWEFPGGKIDPGETPEASLMREIREELACEIEVGALVADVTYPYPHIDVHLMTYMARVSEGRPAVSEHLRLLWLPRPALPSLRWAPADIPTVDVLCATEESE